MSAPYAPARFRDQFLAALDSHDHALSMQLASNLVDCNNPLPGMTCLELGLPAGSTYGCAARLVLERASVTE
ncbi:MAG TPA: hypothetical protein VLI21_08145 [Casimicrobiaceae bacterium]|nr:hypothetical protein [Casimicrobiaceae bacterium]